MACFQCCCCCCDHHYCDCWDCRPRGAPPEVFYSDEDREPSRLNLVLFTSDVGFNKPTGLYGDDRKYVPALLEEKGVTQKDWDLWVGEKLKDDVMSHRHGCCYNVFCHVVPCYLTPCLACCWNVWYGSEVQEWDQALRDWTQEFNREVLDAKGIFLKTQSNAFFRTNKQGSMWRGRRVVTRWLAFSLTTRDKHRLYDEPHLKGDIDNSQCCCAIEEGQLSMHP